MIEEIEALLQHAEKQSTAVLDCHEFSIWFVAAEPAIIAKLEGGAHLVWGTVTVDWRNSRFRSRVYHSLVKSNHVDSYQRTSGQSLSTTLAGLINANQYPDRESYVDRMRKTFDDIER